MREYGENSTMNQNDNVSLNFTRNKHDMGEKVKRETFAYNLTLILLKGEARIEIPGTGSHDLHREELTFIPAETTYQLNITRDCLILEIRFKEISNLFCRLFFKHLTTLCKNVTYRFMPLPSCSAMKDYIEKVTTFMNARDASILTPDYELFVILGVYYPRSTIANFLYPYLLTIKP